jgi:hypothetical protein
MRKMDEILPPKLGDFELEALRKSQCIQPRAAFRIASNPGQRTLATPRKSWVGSF